MHSSVNYDNNNSDSGNDNISVTKHVFTENSIYENRSNSNSLSHWNHLKSLTKATSRDSVKQYYYRSYQLAANTATDSANYCNSFLKLYRQKNEIGEPHHLWLDNPERGKHVSLYCQYHQEKMRQSVNDNVHPNITELIHGTHSGRKRCDSTSTCRPDYQIPKANHPQHRYQSREPTWDYILSERASNNFSTDQHYQHYFSYFYNHGSDTKPELANLNITMSTKPQMERNSQKNNAFQWVNRNLPAENYRQSHHRNILKEKLSNNNIINGFDNGEWLPEYDGNIVKPAEYVSSKDLYNPNLELNNELFNSNGVNQIRAKRAMRTRLESESQDLTAVQYSSNINYVNDDVNRKLQIMKEELTQMPKLPLTPKRIKGGAIPKRTLPSVHRVLIYSNQSPRLLRKSRTQEYKRPSNSANVESSKVLVKATEPNASGEKTSIDFDYDDDYDEDDELDNSNISNFDGSDVSSIGSDNEDGYKAYAYKLTHTMDFPSATKSYLSSKSSDEGLESPESLLVPSLFPYVPPYLSFSSNTKKGPKVPPELHRVLKWRVTNIMPKVVRLILANSGMRLLKKTSDWMGVWGKHLKSPCFKTVRGYQKVNHLPGSFRIGRKDACWKNLQKQMNKHGKREFGFMPRTYVIPNDLCILRKHWPKYSQRNTKWIIKPPASARGVGIRVVNRWAQIPKRKPLIVQKYIEHPLLINGSKFDLRLYVLVTSINPLRVYLYRNGLARFASVKYSSKTDTLNDRCMHLTNYSINKFSSNYSKNDDVNACHGHKWSIKSLWTYLANRGIRTEHLWEALRSLILRTILSGENVINNMIKMNVESKYSVFELFGFDVILDADLVPWLLEVNISPSLHSELHLDACVKAPLVQGVLNTALYNVPPKLTQEKQREIAAEFSLPPDSPLCYDKRMYINYLSREEKIKHNLFVRKFDDRQEYLNSILDKLTPDDVRCLVVAEDELARCAPLERIFPTDQTYKYLKYTETPRYYNRLLDAWETRYAHNRDEGVALLRQLCQEKYHLQVPAPPIKKDCWRAIQSFYWRCRSLHYRKSFL